MMHPRVASVSPLMIPLGLAVLAIGIMLEVATVVLSPIGHEVHQAAGGHLGHLVILIGMVLTLLGVVTDGARAKGRRPRPEGSSRNAIR